MYTVQYTYMHDIKENLIFGQNFNFILLSVEKIFSDENSAVFFLNQMFILLYEINVLNNLWWT